eukprot:6173736-Pleurochrysis_carterae.AAC.1
MILRACAFHTGLKWAGCAACTERHSVATHRDEVGPVEGADAEKVSDANGGGQLPRAPSHGRL